MPRPPRARLKILDAAERIVKERGAANLTYEELVQESGISRGGITYHFGTKEDLLRALVARDLEQGLAAEAAMRERVGDQPGAELIALIRTWCTPDSERRRFVAGMLSAVAHDRSLLDPVRRHHATECAGRCWDGAAIDLSILQLAAEGLFWSEQFGCSELPADQRARVIARMEQLAGEWAVPAPAGAPESLTRRKTKDAKKSQSNDSS